MTAQVTATSASSGNTDVWIFTNNSGSVIDTHLLVVVSGLPPGVTVDATSMTTGQKPLGGTAAPGAVAGLPYYRMFLPAGVLNPGQSIAQTVVRTGGGSSSSYTLKLLSGQGKP